MMQEKMKGMTTAHMTSQKYEKLYYVLKNEKHKYELKVPTSVTKKITIVCNETVMS